MESNHKEDQKPFTKCVLFVFEECNLTKGRYDFGYLTEMVCGEHV